MKKVFIGGSRRISRLSSEVRRRLDRIMEQGLPVLVGDANGADKAVQEYLHGRGYRSVEVFCTGGECRNNLGNWPTRAVPAPKGKKGFGFYATKDQRMAEEASVGLMIWDGRSHGTLANVFRLISQDKKAVVYTLPSNESITLGDETDWERFLSRCPSEARQWIAEYARERGGERDRGEGPLARVTGAHRNMQG